MKNIAIADLLFPDINKDIEFYEKMYPPRKLKEGAKVTRIAPSPTGFIHLGNLYGAVIDERLAHQSDGVFMLRIEDTDSKREVEGAVGLINSTMRFFGIEFDEGAVEKGDKGEYGPYRQRQRRDIYRTFAKYLVANGYAYPCFCTESDLDKMRDRQKQLKENFGYYGKWAIHRDLSYDEVVKQLEQEQTFVIRLRSVGSPSNTIQARDEIRGILSMPENNQDMVLLKSDGIPTYHFAHVIDDHLMRTTHVVRAEEWLPTWPVHLELFSFFGWDTPKFCHTAQLMKMDNGSKRKLSKRKDPELSLEYYRSQGYLPEAVWEYLMTILNSNFEPWRLANGNKDLKEFEFTTAKMSNSGALFDLVKLNDISKQVIAQMSGERVYDLLSAWAKRYDPEFYQTISAEKDKTIAILSIGRNKKKPRKDIYCWSQGKEFIKFVYDKYYLQEDDYPISIQADDIQSILKSYLEMYRHCDQKETWFEKIKLLTHKLGYAVRVKDYKQNPNKYRGNITDVTTGIRWAITGRSNSPDLWAIQQLLGEKAVHKRISQAIR